MLSRDFLNARRRHTKKKVESLSRWGSKQARKEKVNKCHCWFIVKLCINFRVHLISLMDFAGTQQSVVGRFEEEKRKTVDWQALERKKFTEYRKSVWMRAFGIFHAVSTSFVINRIKNFIVLLLHPSQLQFSGSPILYIVVFYLEGNFEIV